MINPMLKTITPMMVNLLTPYLEMTLDNGIETAINAIIYEIEIQFASSIVKFRSLDIKGIAT